MSLCEAFSLSEQEDLWQKETNVSGMKNLYGIWNIL